MARKLQVRGYVISGLAIAAAGLLVFLFAPRPLEVEAAAVRRGPIAEAVTDQGVARVRQAYVVSAPVAGRVERLPLEVGDRVVAGVTVVARLRSMAPSFLDPRARAQALAALASAQAQRERLNAEAVRAAGALARLGPLAQQGMVSRQSLDDAQAAADAAKNAVRAAEADVNARRADLASVQSGLTGPQAAGSEVIAITSPASGVVTHLLQQSERSMEAGSPLIEIGDTQGLEAQIEFLSQDAVKIRPGQRAEIYNWGGPGMIPAQVRRIEPQGFTKVSALGVEEQRTLVMLQFTGPPAGWAGLEPGYRVWGRVYLRETPSAVVAPLGALVRDRGGWAVFRIERGRARLRPVRVGALSDHDAEILSGAAPGDVLVDYPSDQVRDGARVRSKPGD